MRRFKIDITTDASGAATQYSPIFSGKLHQLEYVKGNFDDGVDFTITGEKTGIGLWTEANVNASTVRAPRLATHSQVGAALLYAAGGAAVADKIALAADRVKIVIAQGGNAKTGTFYVLVDEL